MSASLTVEIDEAPLDICPPTGGDYISRQICSALYSPLLKWDHKATSLNPGIVLDWESADGGLAWELFLRADMFWNDGSPICADNVIAGLTSAARHPLWGRYLRFIRSLELPDERVLRINLHHPFSPLLRLLTVVDLSPTPTQRCSGASHSGYYCLSSWSHGASYDLVPNPTMNLPSLPTLHFLVNRFPESSITGFINEIYDVTSNTSFPLKHLNEWSDCPEFRTGETGISMQVEFNPLGNSWLRDPAARQALFLAIDRAAISEAFRGGLRPAGHFGPACWEELCELKLSDPDPEYASSLVTRLGKPSIPLRIHFNNYAPNHDVLDLIVTSWKRILGLDFEAVSVPFWDVGRSDFDLLFALRFPSFPSPWAVLEHYAVLSSMLSATSAEMQWKFLTQWLLNSPDAPPHGEVAQALRTDLPVLPLFDIIGCWLQRTGHYEFPYPEDGHFDYTALLGKTDHEP